MVYPGDRVHLVGLGLLKAGAVCRVTAYPSEAWVGPTIVGLDGLVMGPCVPYS